MRPRRFDWEGAGPTARAMRLWILDVAPTAEEVDVEPIRREVLEGGDAAVRRLTARFGGPEDFGYPLALDPAAAQDALTALDPRVREALELAAANIRAVAEAQVDSDARRIDLPQGQTVTVGSVPVGSAGIYAPGGKAFYPSSVLMCAIPARVAGVERIALASPPGADGKLNPIVLAAAALGEVDEIHAMGGAQAVFALAYGTETVEKVDVIAGPGNAWVQEAKRAVSDVAGIDSYAGPSELMVIAGHDADPRWAALDLCAQAEHGAESPLVVAAVEEAVLDRIAAATEAAAAAREGVGDAPLALVQVPDLNDAVELANAFAPEHLQLMEQGAARLADGVSTAGCVFVGHHGATAFGDYAAGSNHVLPTGGSGRFAGPLGPGVFRRLISVVDVSAAAAEALAPHVETIAGAEGFPVHGESAMIRARSDG